MNKIINFLKKFVNVFLSSTFRFPRNLFLIFGIIIFILILTDIKNVESYKIIFSAIALTTGLASLSFRGGSSVDSDNKIKKDIFYQAGERLFHSTLLLTIVLILKFIFSISIISTQSSFFIGLFYYLYFIPALGFGLCAVVFSILAIEALNKILWKDSDKILDSLNSLK